MSDEPDGFDELIAPASASDALAAAAADGPDQEGATPARRAPKKRRKRSPLRKTLFIGGGIVAAGALVLGGAGIASALTAGSDYRTAKVERASVTETVDANGTVASASRYDLAFQTGGTVETVDVKVGDTVKAGQQLASLDESDLQEAVADAEETLTTAQQTLAEHQETQASGGTSSSTAASTAASTTAVSSASGSSSAGSAASGASGGSGASGVSGVSGSSGGTADTASDSGGSGGTGTSGGGATGGSAADPAVAAAMQQVTDAQQALLAKYQEVQGTIDSTNGIVATASSTCQVFLDAALADASGGADPGDAGSGDAGSGEGADAGADPGADPSADPGVAAGTAAGMTLEEAQAALAACQTEIANVQSGQAAVSAGQQEVQDLAAALNSAVDDLRAAVEAASSESGGSGGAGSEGSGSNSSGSGSNGSGSGSNGSGAGSNGSGSGASGGSASGGTGGSGSSGETSGGSSAGSSSGAPSGGASSSGASGGSTTITAEQLLADQAAIDVAEADLEIAQARLAFSAITSPIAGRVAAVSLAAGDTVSAGSDSAVITVIGDDGYVVETTVPLNSVGKLKIGQSVQATVAANGKSYAGEVSSIGVLNVSSTSTPAFAVVVALDAGDDRLLNGGSARLAIEAAAVEDALTVPSSAIHRDGSATTVDVLQNGSSKSVEVELGAVGAERTEILSGLDEGQQVILADLRAAIGGEDESSNSGGLAGLGGSSNGGFGGGSAPGGGDFPSPPGGGFPGQ